MARCWSTTPSAPPEGRGEVVAPGEGLGKEKVRRWVAQTLIDGGQRQGPTSEELAEIKKLKAKVR